MGSLLARPAKNQSSQSLSAFYAFQKLAERDLEGGCQRCQVAETDLAHTSLEVRYVNLVNTRLFGKVNLPPTPFLSELPDFFAKLDANIRRHSSTIDLVEALYLVDALSRELRAKDRPVVPISRFGPDRDVRPIRKSYEFFNQGGIAAMRCGLLKKTGNDDSL